MFIILFFLFSNVNSYFTRFFILLQKKTFTINTLQIVKNDYNNNDDNGNDYTNNNTTYNNTDLYLIRYSNSKISYILYSINRLIIIVKPK